MTRAPGTDRRIGRLFTVTRPGSPLAGRVGILEAIAPETGTHVLRMKRPAGRYAFAAFELTPFDSALMKDADR